VVPEEWNVLVNPAHPDFRRMAVGDGSAYCLDTRIAETLGK